MEISFTKDEILFIKSCMESYAESMPKKLPNYQKLVIMAGCDVVIGKIDKMIEFMEQNDEKVMN